MDPKLQALLEKRRKSERETDPSTLESNGGGGTIGKIENKLGRNSSRSDQPADEGGQKMSGMDPKLKALLAKRHAASTDEDELDEKVSPARPELASAAIDTRSVFVHIEQRGKASNKPGPQPHDALSSMAIARRSHSTAGKDVDTRSLFDHISAAWADDAENPSATDPAPAGSR